MDKFVFEDEVVYLLSYDKYGFYNTEIHDGENLTSDRIIREMQLWDGDRVRIIIEKV